MMELSEGTWETGSSSQKHHCFDTESLKPVGRI